MNTISLLTTAASLALISAASAQIQIPINPKATYLRVYNDPSAVPAPAIPLTALGVAPGDWLSITTVGSYSANGGLDNSENLACVFSSSPTLLISSTSVVSRVPGAIAAGPAAFTYQTYQGGQATDIAEDFFVARNSWANGTLVKVPAGATHLFMSVFNQQQTFTYFTNNGDPNSDYFAVFTPVQPATMQGTAEHCELHTGVNALPTTTPDVKPASPFATVSVEVAQRFGVSTGQIFAIGANIYSTGGTPPLSLPGFYLGTDMVLVQVGVMTAAPGLWSFFVPPGHPGTTLILQGFFLTDTARNGLFSSTDAHRIELQ